MKRVLVLLISLVFVTQCLYAVPAPTPYYAYDGEYPGGRSLATGYAFTAVSGNPASVYFNPAGLFGIIDNVVAFSWDVARQSDLTPTQIFANEPIRQSSLMFLSFCSQQGALSWRPLSDTVKTTTNGVDWESDEVKIFALSFSAAEKNEDNVISGIHSNY